MPFRFSLAAVQVVRKQREQQEERALTGLLQEIQLSRQALHRIEDELHQAVTHYLNAAPQVIQGTKLHEHYARLQLLRQAQSEMLSHLSDLAVRRDQQQALYLVARRDRELIDELKTKQHASFHTAMLRQEGKRNDDLFLARRLRN